MEAAMTRSQSLADEWDSYCWDVLGKTGQLTPERLVSLRMIFFAGACAALTLVGPEAIPVAALLAELREHAASIREREAAQ
jgi:hypothetical protein